MDGGRSIAGPEVSGQEPSGPPVASTSWRWIAAVVLLLLLATGALYRPVSGFDFLNFDDDRYVTKNLPMQRGWDAGVLTRAFTTPLVGNWQPVTYLSHALDVQLFGLNPAGHHWISVAFHAANALLLLLLVRSMGGGTWASFFVAALFALHPLRIESVAWIAERKDVLCAFYFLLAALVYVRSGGARRLPAYLLVSLFFGLALLSKPMAVTLPCVLLLLDFWPLPRDAIFSSSSAEGRVLKNWLGLLLHKAPLLLLSVALGVVTIVTQRDADAVRSLDAMSLGLRMQTAVVALAAYLAKFVWPADLSPFYTHPGSWSSWQVIGCGMVVLVLSLLAVLLRKSRPWWLVGWLWYVGMLVPVIGIVQVGDQWMADRYTYLPLIGLTVALGMEGQKLAATNRVVRPLVWIAALAMLCASFVASSQQLPIWQNSGTLSKRAITTDGGHWSMRTNHAISLAQSGNMPEAIVEFEAIYRDFPADPETLNNLGFALLSSGRSADAIPYLARAVALNSAYYSARINLGRAFQTVGNIRSALDEFERVIEDDAGDPAAYLFAASIYANDAQLGQPRRAVELASAAIERSPHPNLRAIDVLATAHARAGQLPEARAVFEQGRQMAFSAGRPDIAAEFVARARALEKAP